MFPIRFPEIPYAIQSSSMKNILKALNETGSHNVLIDSPTGTGKSLFVSIPVIEHMINEHSVSKIYYITRTNQQVRQLMKSLKETNVKYKHSFKIKEGTLMSKKHMCINPNVSKEHCGEQCSKLLQESKTLREKRDEDPVKYRKMYHSQKNKVGCTYHTKYVEKFHSQDKSKPALPYHALINQPLISSTLYDMEDLMNYSRNSQICPYYLSKDILIPNAELIIVTYPYLIDNNIRQLVKLNTEQSIVIFDEAHNILDVARDWCQFECTDVELDNLVKELAVVKNYCSPIYTPIHMALKQFANTLINIDKKTEKKKNDENKNELFFSKDEWQPIDKNKTENKTIIFKKSQKKELFNNMLITLFNFKNILDKLLIHLNNHLDLLHSNSKEKFTGDKDSKILQRHYRGVMTKNNTEKLINLLSISHLMHKENMKYADDFLLTRTTETNCKQMRKNKKIVETNKILRLKCMNAEPGLDHLKEAKHLICMSGTFPSHNSFERQSGFQFQTKIVNDHVINKHKQLKVLAISNYNDTQLNSAYKYYTKSKNYTKQLAIVLMDIIKHTPGGKLFFFPSYGFLNRCVKEWDSQLKQMHSMTMLFVESNDGTFNSEEALEMYKKKAIEPGGAAMFAVCRGKCSEGLDLKGRLCNSVTVIGLPFQNYTEMNIKNKIDYHDQRREKEIKKGKHIESELFPKGSTWLNENAFNCINQAIGRVIRNKQDCGIVFLLDCRYEHERYNKQLSDWIKPCLKIHDNMDEDKLQSIIKPFFQQNGQ